MASVEQGLVIITTYGSVGSMPASPQGAAVDGGASPGSLGHSWGGEQLTGQFLHERDYPEVFRTGATPDLSGVSGGSPPVVISYQNTGWCLIHGKEMWPTMGSPGPEPGEGGAHIILDGSRSYLILP